MYAEYVFSSYCSVVFKHDDSDFYLDIYASTLYTLLTKTLQDYVYTMLYIYYCLLLNI